MSAFDTPGSAAQRYDALASAPPVNPASMGPSLMDGFGTDLAKVPTDVAGRFAYNLEESVVTPARLAVGHVLGDEDYINAAQDAHLQMQRYYQDNFVAPASVGAASQVLIHGVGIPLVEYMLGAATGTKFVGAGYTALTTFNTAKIAYEAQGLSPLHAGMLAAGQGAVAGGVALIPGGIGIKEGATNAVNALRVGAAQGGINLVTGVGTRAATQAYLADNGYADLAAQVHPFSVAEGVTDAALGSGLGYLHTRYFPHKVAAAKPGENAPPDLRNFGVRADEAAMAPGAPGAEPAAAPAPPAASDVEAANARAEALAAGDIAALGGEGEPPDEGAGGGGVSADVPASPTLDDAMTVNSAGHANVDVAPGPPADVGTMNRHAEAVSASALALMRGDAVSVEGTLQGAHFLDNSPAVEAEHAEHIAHLNLELAAQAHEQDAARAVDLGVPPESLAPVEKPLGLEDVRQDIGREAPAVPSAAAATKRAQKFAKAMTGALLRKIKSLGGINITEAADITGESRQRAVRLAPGLFRNGGAGIDAIADHLFAEGLITPEERDSVDGGVDRARDIVRAALDGEPVMHPDDAIAHAKLVEAAQYAHDTENERAQGRAHPDRFWTDRPDKSLTVEGAHAALDRAGRGEPLGAREQRFVDYAREEAARREADRQELGAADRETQAERAAIMADNTPEELADVGYTDVPMRDQLEVAHLLSYADHLGELDDEANALRASDNAEFPGTHEGHGPGTPGEDSGNGGGTSSAQEGARRYNAGVDDAAGNQRASATDEAIKQARRDPYTQDIFGRALPETATGGTADGGTIPAGDVDVHAGPTVPAREVERGIFATFVKHVTTAIARLGLTHIKSAADAAHVFAYLRKMPQENLVLMTVDKDGKPLAISRHSIGGRASTFVELPTVMGSALRDPRAAGFYVAHNHPSGPNAEKFSEDDLKIHNSLVQAARGGRAEYHGLFAIAGTKYLFTGAHKANVFTDSAGAERGAIPAAARTHAIPIEERRFTRAGKMGDPIRSPADAVHVAREVAKGQEGVVLLGAQHEPVGFLPLDLRSLSNMRGKLADRFWSAIEATNAGAMLAVSQGTIQSVRYGALHNLANFGARAGVRLLDAVTMGDQANLGSALSASSHLQFDEPAPKGAPGAKAEPGAAHDLLTPYSNADILRREQEQQAQSKRDVESAAKAKAKAIADGQRDAFALTGSDRLADQSGQGGLFEPGPAGYGEYPGTHDDPVPRDVVLAADDARIAEAAKAPDVLGAAVQCFLTMGGT